MGTIARDGPSRTSSTPNRCNLVVTRPNGFGPESSFTIYDECGTLHTSCSQPLYVGMGIGFLRGRLEIVDFRVEPREGCTSAPCTHGGERTAACCVSDDNNGGVDTADTDTAAEFCSCGPIQPESDGRSF